VDDRADSYGKVDRKISGVERTICGVFPHRYSPQYWAGCSRRVAPCEALVRNNVFKVIKIFYHSRVGRTTTEVAFEFPSVVPEPNIRDPNVRVADIRTEWPTSRPLPSSDRFALRHFYKVFMPSLRLRRYVVCGMLSKESVCREQCDTSVRILYPA